LVNKSLRLLPSSRKALASTKAEILKAYKRAISKEGLAASLLIPTQSSKEAHQRRLITSEPRIL